MDWISLFGDDSICCSGYYAVTETKYWYGSGKLSKIACKKYWVSAV